MSEQLDAHLQLPASYNFQRERVGSYRNSPLDPQKFHLWLKHDMYRSSYAQHHSPDSLNPRAAHLPGYAGFIPTDRAESLHAKTYTNKTKDVLNNPNINANKAGLSTTGFNLRREALVDESKVATSHRYGKTQIQTPHPAWIPQRWSSTTKSTYISPEKHVNPTYRETEKHVQTHKMKTKQSGFQRDRAYWDGNGWKPNPILNPADLTSQYRDRFNSEVDYHRKVQVDLLPQLKKPEYKYRFNK